MRKSSHDAVLSVKAVGQKLRDERKRKGKRLYDVWRAIKIRPNYLAAIEEGRFEDLPGRAFAIGYAGRYARYLQLDIGKFQERLEAEIGPHEGARDHPIDVKPLFGRKFPVLGIGVASLLLIALAYSSDDIIDFAMRADERAPEESSGRTIIDVPVPAPIEQQTHFAAPELLPIQITVTPRVSLRAQLPPQRVQAQLPPGRRYGLQNRNSRITLRVHRPTIVAIRDGRNRIFIDRKLTAGDTYRVPNLIGLWLTAIDAGAVEIVLDGASVGFAGTQGAAVRDQSLNPQSIAANRRRSNS